MDTKIGVVIHYYDKIKVAILNLMGALSVGDRVTFRWHEQEFEQTIQSVHINHEPIQTAKKGQVVGVKVSQDVREGTEVFIGTTTTAPKRSLPTPTAQVARPMKQTGQKARRPAKRVRKTPKGRTPKKTRPASLRKPTRGKTR